MRRTTRNSNTTWGMSATEAAEMGLTPTPSEGRRDPALRVRALFQAASQEVERRINSVWMVLLAVAILMAVTFGVQAGATTRAVTIAQVVVLSAWLFTKGAVALFIRAQRGLRSVPYIVLTTDVVMVCALVVVRMMYMPDPWQVRDGVLSDWVYVALFPVVASAGPRFDVELARYVELLALAGTLALLIFDIALMGHHPRLFYVMITLVALMATGQFAVMVAERGRRLVGRAMRFWEVSTTRAASAETRSDPAVVDQ